MANEELKQLFSEKLRYWLNKSEKNQTDLAKYMNVSSATASDWCNGKKLPRTDKIQIICNWLGIELQDLLEDKPDDTPDYYFNDDARELAQFLHDNPAYKTLFDATRKVKKEDIEFIRQLIERTSGN